MIQKEPIWRTMWGPCFGHKRAIFWPFLGKGNYGVHPELWNLAWSILGHIDYDSGRTNLKDHVRTAVDLWSCFIEEASFVLLKSWFFFWLIDIKYQVATNYCWYWLSYHLHRKCPKILETSLAQLRSALISSALVEYLIKLSSDSYLIRSVC